MSILVITRDTDTATDAVVHRLVERGCEVYRFDTRDFPRQARLTARLDDNGVTGTLRLRGRIIGLDSVRTVWYRNPSVFDVDAGAPYQVRQHLRLEAKFGFGGALLALPGVRWVNHPGRSADMMKPVQLSVARDCGLLTLPTVITNDAEAAREFASECSQVAMKHLGAAFVNDGHSRRMVYTQRLSVNDFDRAGASMALTAHQFQKFVVKTADVRVTVVGASMFAAAMYPHSPAAAQDFRADYQSLSYELIDIPTTVAAGIRAFMDYFGLQFAGIDFVLDDDGTWWFLEANSTGQWGWIEHHTNAPITNALVNLLAEGDHCDDD
ncbi:MvdC/MvdD family ATP grasp protein [Salininema proteolyticum]|uniref:MvdC/MvdD family ATP grasp protein n=1 Tax=Salininema proteolyticum TaxID=1607685 RepID=A0ABV8TZU0_9ACTN